MTFSGIPPIIAFADRGVFPIWCIAASASQRKYKLNFIFMDSSGKKYVVTGGAGFIGSHIVDALIARGDEVHVIDLFLTGKRERLHPKAIMHEADIRDETKLPEIFRGARGVFHTAAQPRMQYSIQKPRLTNDINITGTLNVLLAARDA